MNRLTVELPEQIYQQLIKQAENQQKLPEQLAREKLIAEFGITVRSKDQAQKIAERFLARTTGTALEPRTPAFNKKLGLWQVPVAIELPIEDWTEVGTLEIDAKTGVILQESPTFAALWERFKDLLGIEEFSVEKQTRMSELLDLGNRGELTESLQAELLTLLKESERQQNENLQRLAQRLPARRNQ